MYKAFPGHNLKPIIMNALHILDSTVNVGKTGRVQSLLSGASLIFSSLGKLKSSPKMSVLKTMLGGYLIYRGLSGHCHLNQVADKTTAREF